MRSGFVFGCMVLGLFVGDLQSTNGEAPPPVPEVVTEDLERASALVHDLTDTVGGEWPWQVWEDSFACFSNEGTINGYQASARRKFKTPTETRFDYERALNTARDWFADNGFEIVQDRAPGVIAKAHELRAVNEGEDMGIIVSGRPGLFSVRATVGCRKVG